MTEQFKAATIRALYGGIVTALAVLIATLQATDFENPRRFEIAGLAAVGALVAYLLARGVAEGLIDSNRGPTSADVGQPRR